MDSVKFDRDTNRAMRNLSHKQYELSNHLGNVLSTVLDRKTPITSSSGSGGSGGSTTVTHYEGDVVFASDYYPFGSPMSWTTSDSSGGRLYSGGGYRYGFNGQEKTDEISSGHYTAEYWEYDSRIGRRWNLDPITKPDRSNYSVLGNNPIIMIDPLGNTEYESYDAYKKAQGDKAVAEKGWTGQDGHWLASDRSGWEKGTTNRFSTANEFNITKDNGSSNYVNLEQREAFYNWFQSATEAKGFEIKWAGGAAMAVDKLEWLVDGWGSVSGVFGYSSDEIESWVKAGNKLILDDVWGDLKSLYSGSVLKGKDAYNWDANQLLREQQVINPSYWNLSNASLTTLENSLKKNYWGAKLFTMSSPTFKGTLLNVTDRWVYGMTLMKYKVTAADVPIPPVCPQSPAKK